jgi:acetoacetyl-CoA synthetase
VKETVLLSSIAGGTDIISCFMLGNPMLPVYSEEIQCRGLGMAVEAWDDNKKPLIDIQGELVCTRIFPSMPVNFWNDKSGDLYKDAYFNHFDGVWRHGDYVKITKNGGVVVYGRSDATLNPGGVRIGTAEIYRVLENIPEISDSLAVGLPQNNDVIIILFVVLKDNFSLNSELESKIRSIIKQELTPRHLPKHIRQINEIPVTLNGKKVETAVTKVLTGQHVSNKDSLLNPKSLDQFENLAF